MSSSQLTAWDKPMVHPFLFILLPNFLENSTASLLECGGVMSCCNHITVLQQAQTLKTVVIHFPENSCCMEVSKSLNEM